LSLERYIRYKSKDRQCSETRTISLLNFTLFIKLIGFSVSFKLFYCYFQTICFSSLWWRQIRIQSFRSSHVRGPRARVKCYSTSLTWTAVGVTCHGIHEKVYAKTPRAWYPRAHYVRDRDPFSPPPPPIVKPFNAFLAQSVFRFFSLLRSLSARFDSRRTDRKWCEL